MENNNYEQEFIQNVKRTSQPVPSRQTALKTSANTSVAPLVIAIILALVVLIESIALAIFAVNYGEALDLYGGDYSSEIEYDSVSDSPEALSEASSYNYDDDYNITAFDLTCTTDDGSKYTFTKSKSYQKTDASSNSTSSGSYSIINSGAVVLNSSNTNEEKIVYYDGYDIIEGTTFYACEEN